MAAPHNLREQYRQDKAAVADALLASGASSRGIRQALRQFSGLADACLSTLWQQAALPPDLCLVAVGGFGRGELFPYSDVDVLLLLPDGKDVDTDAPLKAMVEAFIGSCWDAGLEIGSSVRTLAECLAESAKDVTVQTSLLEARHITGSAVKLAESRGIALDQLPLADLQAIDARVDERVYAALSVEASVAARASYGGTAPEQVKARVAEARVALGLE